MSQCWRIGAHERLYVNVHTAFFVITLMIHFRENTATRSFTNQRVTSLL